MCSLRNNLIVSKSNIQFTYLTPYYNHTKQSARENKGKVGMSERLGASIEKVHTLIFPLAALFYPQKVQ